MKGYWVAHVTVHNPEGYRAYRAAAAEPIAAFGGRFLALGGAQETVEGSMRPDTVIVEFPSPEAAHACWHSPAYQETVMMRAPHAAVDLSIIAGA